MSYLSYILSGSVLASWLVFSAGYETEKNSGGSRPPLVTDYAGDAFFQNKDGFPFVHMPVDTPPPTPNPNTGPGDPTTHNDDAPFTMPNPSNIEIVYELDEEGNGYYIHEQVGGIDVRPPSYITMADYLKYRKEKGMQDYWKGRVASGDEVMPEGLLPELNIPIEKIRDIFRGGAVEIRPNGTALLDLGGEINRIKNPSLPIRQQRTANLKFDQQIQLNVVGKIGEALRLNANWDTQATFDFENQLKLEYTGTEDQILQKLEAGNVSLPLNGSLISGGQNLFGIKMALKFGPLIVTTIASQQKGKTQSVDVQGGAQQTLYEKKGNEYDEYRHFFLSHYFRERYDYALSNLPTINSGINITRIEVWITNNNSSSAQNNRNAVGFIDLGESTIAPDPSRPTHKGLLFDAANPSVLPTPGHTGMPDNEANVLYELLSGDTAFSEKSTVDNACINDLGFQNGLHFEKIENMRKLNDNEYTVQNQLGYISLNSALQANQVLYVAYQYQYLDSVYQVGDFSQDPNKQANPLNSNVLFLKMIKPSSVKPQHDNRPYPTWDLMMKNIYSIGGYGLKADNFEFNLQYDSRTSSGVIGYLPSSPVKDKPLLQVFELDNLSNNSENLPDNKFDFIPGMTINPEKGLIIFPLREPFGSYLESKMDGNAEDIDKYVFNELYDLTRQDAIQYAQVKDRFLIKGSYQGAAGAEISLNSINIAPGSVKVTANGTLLQEGSDYTVDYNVGKVIIKNAGYLASGQQIKVTYETNSLFGLESRTLVGSRFDLNLSKDIQLGATVLHLNERPMTGKITIGEEPVSNLMYGVDAVIRKDSRWITRWLIDPLPGLQTKEISTVTFQAEGAMLDPGHPRAIEVGDEKGITYLDAFEGAKQTYDLMGYRAWTLASFPGNNSNNGLYVPGPGYDASLSSGFSRAKLLWYSIDPTFFYGNMPKDEYPEDVFAEDMNYPYTRLVSPTEVFPNQTVITGDNLHTTFDLYYIPDERGPYNYEVDDTRIGPDGKFFQPEDNWAGITRKTGNNTDFEMMNYEFIEFWMMDPFMADASNAGSMYLNLGRVSEDVVRDGNRNFENGLPGDPANTSTIGETSWGRYPIINPVTNTFDNDEAIRVNQDVGLDGLKNDMETSFFQQYLDSLAANFGAGSAIYNQASADPSTDFYSHFRGEAQNGKRILDRYRDFNGHEGNTPIQASQNGYSTQGNPNPDTEDLNNNGTLNQIEEYWEYKISMNQADFQIGRNYIVDIIETAPEDVLPNGKPKNTKWYQFRVPLTSGKSINNIPNFKAIEFVRMYLTDFERPVNVRFARFQAVAPSWRTFRDYLGIETDTIIDPAFPATNFEIGTVNIEENSGRSPFNYIMPPDVARQLQVGSPTPNLLQNEQSLVLKVCDLYDGDGRGVFKLFNHDLRSYKNLKMWIHAENIPGSGKDFAPGELRAFIRLGSDVAENYYEYEIPLTASAPGDQTIENIWPEINEMFVDLAKLNTAKAFRNDEGFPVGSRYEFIDSETGNRIFVKGTPRLDQVKNIMVGIRNENDGRGPICAEVWVNELRLTDFNEFPGYAANARLNVKLADWGNVTLAGSKRTPGFGSIEQKIMSRSREDITQFDLSGTFQMGMFMPKKWGVQLPMFVSWGEKIINPLYNPLEADVFLDDYLKNIENPDSAKKIRESMQDYTRTKTISFNNVRLVRVQQQDPGKGGSATPGKPAAGGSGSKGPKTHPWDVQNFNASFAYSEIFSRNQLTEHKLQTSHRAQLQYSYTFTNKPIEPFKNAKWKSIITAFNFNPLPKSVTLGIQGERRYEENFFRQVANQNPIEPTYFKTFPITRTYQIRWDLTRTLTLNFSATNLSRVFEPYGQLDTKIKRDSLLGNILSFGRENDSLGRPIIGKDKLINIGRNSRYNHTIGANWILPTDKFKLTNWVSGTLGYNGDVTWSVGPDNFPAIGNVIENSQSINAQGRLNLDNLYSKIPGVKNIISDGKKPTGPTAGPGPKGPAPDKSKDPTSEKAPDTAQKDDSTYKFIKAFGKELVRTILSVKTINLSWTRNAGTRVPGYMPQTDNFGMDFGYVDANGNPSSSVPPSLPFLAGWQENFLSGGLMMEDWARSGWLTQSASLANQFSMTVNEQLTGQTSITFFKDFKIDLNITRSQGKNYSELFRFDSTAMEYGHFNKLLTGNYSISYIFINSAFDKNDENPEHWAEFENSARQIISYELSKVNPFTDKNTLIPDAFNNGYSANSQDVLLPAFLGAYSVANPRKLVSGNTERNLFPAIPLPNWSVNYNGLSKLPAFKNVFTSVLMKHAYRGTYSIGSFTNDIKFIDTEAGFTDQLIQTTDSTLDYRSRYVIQSASFTESFSPLLGFTFNFKNGMAASVDYKQDRNLSFTVGNKQLTEARRKDLLVSFSWRKDKLNMNFSLFGRDLNLQNSLNTRVEVTMRDNRTRNRQLDSEVEPAFTQGTFMLIIKPSIDYVVNTKLNLRFYVEHSRTRPVVSNSYPSNYTAFGFQVRFTLAN